MKDDFFEQAVNNLSRFAKERQQRASLLTIVRDLYRDANPTILDDADTGVRLPPEWNERIEQILKELENGSNP